MKRQVQRQLCKIAEEKYFDFAISFGPTVSFTGVTWTGKVIKITNITQGTDATERIGNKIFIKDVYLKWSIDFPWTGDQVLVWQARCLVFIWRADSTPNRDDIIAVPSLPDTALLTLAPYNHDNEKNLFCMLYDECLDAAAYNDGVVGVNNILSFDKLHKQAEFFMNISDIKNDLNIVNYTEIPPNGPPITGINNIYCMLLSTEDPTLANYTWNTSFVSRVTFCDM